MLRSTFIIVNQRILETGPAVDNVTVVLDNVTMVTDEQG